MPVKRVTIQFTTATPNANVIPKNMLNTTKSAPCVFELRIMNQPNTPLTIVRTASEGSDRGCRRLAETNCFRWQARRRFGKYQRDDENIKCVKSGQHDAWNESAFVHVADRAANWSAITISTSEGGMICAKVPEAAITPLATRRS